MSVNTDFYSGRRVLVTGGFGFLGLNPISHLVANAAQVRVLGHVAPSVASLGTGFLHGAARVEGDIRNENDGRGQLTCLRACAEAKARLKLVLPSSRLVYKPTTHQPVNGSAATGPISI